MVIALPCWNEDGIEGPHHRKPLALLKKEKGTYYYKFIILFFFCGTQIAVCCFKCLRRRFIESVKVSAKFAIISTAVTALKLVLVLQTKWFRSGRTPGFVLWKRDAVQLKGRCRLLETKGDEMTWRSANEGQKIARAQNSRRCTGVILGMEKGDMQILLNTPLLKELHI